MNIVEAAEIINSLNETSFNIPKSIAGIQEVKEDLEEKLAKGTLTGGISIDEGVKFTIRRHNSGGGRAGAVSKHSCTIKHYLKGRRGIPVSIPQSSYYEYGKKKGKSSIIDELYSLKSINKGGEALFRCICDNQAIITAIWKSSDDKTETALIKMLVERIIARDYFNTKPISAPKTEKELDKDREEIKTYLASYNK